MFHHRPLVSVVIPTYNRAALLEGSLRSLGDQTLRPEDYEVVVVDDGSRDDTKEVCARLAAEVPLRYWRVANSGIAAAKNVGVFVSRAPILLFFDDDDLADSGLLEQHVEAHRRYADPTVAVLGYTTWAPGLPVSPVMNFVTNVGQVLFAYPSLQDGQWLDFGGFWGGRSSCKRTLLVRHGVFDQRFRFGYEDIELGHRLNRATGFRVLFRRQALSFMVRPMSCDDVCSRCERQGRSLWLFSTLHEDADVQRYCAEQAPDPIGRREATLAASAAKWPSLRRSVKDSLRRIAELEQPLTARPEALEPRQLAELHAVYQWTFRAHVLKGAFEAMSTGPSPGDPALASVGLQPV